MSETELTAIRNEAMASFALHGEDPPEELLIMMVEEEDSRSIRVSRADTGREICTTYERGSVFRDLNMPGINALFRDMLAHTKSKRLRKALEAGLAAEGRDVD
jgi:hypothetical protein